LHKAPLSLVPKIDLIIAGQADFDWVFGGPP
jgi:hypothetical protein